MELGDVSFSFLISKACHENVPMLENVSYLKEDATVALKTRFKTDK